MKGVLVAAVLVIAAKNCNEVTTRGVGDADLAAFTRSGLDGCDARVLGALWQIPTSQAPYAIGWRLGQGERAQVDADLANAREAVDKGSLAVTCRVQDTPFEGRVVDLARVWGLTALDTETRIGDLAARGKQAEIAAALEQGEGEITPALAEEAFARREGYACEAAILGAHGEVSLSEARVAAGTLLLNDQQAELATQLATAREALGAAGTQPCSAEDEGLTYGDLEALAGWWEVGVDEAKARVGQALFDGKATWVAIQLANARE